MNTHRIAAIPGEGIGTEVSAAGLEVLTALAAPATAASGPNRHTLAGAPTDICAKAR